MKKVFGNYNYPCIMVILPTLLFQDSRIEAQYLEKQFESVRIQFEETKGLLQQQSSNNGNTVEETLKLEMRLQEESKAKEDLQSRLAKETLAKLGLEKEVLSLKVSTKYSVSLTRALTSCHVLLVDQHSIALLCSDIGLILYFVLSKCSDGCNAK